MHKGFAIIALLVLVSCGTTTQHIAAAPPAAKTVTVSLHAGEHLSLGGYTIAVLTITGNTVEMTINNQALTVPIGATVPFSGSTVEAALGTDSAGPVAQIRVTDSRKV